MTSPRTFQIAGFIMSALVIAQLHATPNATMMVNGTDCVITAWSGGQPRGVVASFGGKKQISGVSYDPLVVEVPFPLNAVMTTWISDFCAGTGGAKPLVLGHQETPDRYVELPLQASNAQLTQVQLTALDGSSKERASLTLTFVAESIRFAPAAVPPNSFGKRKASLASNFRVSIAGLPSDRIATVSSLTLHRAKSGGPAEVSNLTLQVSNADTAAWTDWRDDFLVLGHNSDAQEKNGSISLLDPAMKESSLTFTLSHVGLVRLEPAAQADEKIQRIEAELYIESASLVPPAVVNAGNGAAAPAVGGEVALIKPNQKIDAIATPPTNPNAIAVKKSSTVPPALNKPIPTVVR